MCVVRTRYTMGVLMQNHTASNVRRQLAVLGMLAITGLFSIGAATSGPAHSGPVAQADGSTSSTTPNGVFGWD